MRVIDMRPPRILMALALGAAACHWLLHGWTRPRTSVPWAGGLVGLAGLGIMLWAWWLFKQADTAICPTAPTIRLLTRGPYRFTRNPMYLGMVLMLLGLAAGIGSAPFYLATLAALAILHGVFCPYEERKLLGTFGEAYRSYQSRVRRWI